TDKLASFRHGIRVAACFDDNVGTTAAGCISYQTAAFVRRGRGNIRGPVRAHRSRGGQSNIGSTEDPDPSRPAEPSQGRATEADRPAALHQNAVTQPDLRQLDSMYGGGKATSAADPGIRRDARLQPHQSGARPQIDPLRPAARKPWLLLRAIG